LLHVCKGKNCKLNEEVVEDIGIVSLQRNSIWTDSNGENTFNFFRFFVLVIISSSIYLGCCLVLIAFLTIVTSTLRINVRAFGFGLHLIKENSKLQLSQHNVNIVVDFNVHLNSVDNI